MRTPVGGPKHHQVDQLRTSREQADMPEHSTAIRKNPGSSTDSDFEKQMTTETRNPWSFVLPHFARQRLCSLRQSASRSTHGIPGDGI